MMHAHLRQVVVGALSTLCLQCHSGEPIPLEASAPSEASVVPAASAEDPGLRRTLDAWGLPVPEGARLEEELPGALHYGIDAEYDQLMAFFARELDPGFSITRYTHGVKIEPVDANGRSIYLYRELGQSGWLLTYFESDRRADTVAQPGSGAAPAVPAALPAETLNLHSQVGEVVEGSAAEAPLPGGRLRRTEPRVHPRVRRLLQQRAADPPPLNFSRGVTAPRQNTNAMF